MENQQIISVIGGAIVGLLPILVTAIISWMDKRSMLNRRTQALSLAQQRVEFLSAWLKAQEPLCAPGQWEELKVSVSKELLQLRSGLTDVLAEEPRRLGEEDGERSFVQKLFLLYRPHTAGGWVFHTLFYMLLGVTIIGVLSLVYAVFAWADEVSVAVSDVVLLVAIPSVLGLVFRQMAAKADRRADQQLAAQLAAEIAKEEDVRASLVVGHQ